MKFNVIWTTDKYEDNAKLSDTLGIKHNSDIFSNKSNYRFKSTSIKLSCIESYNIEPNGYGEDLIRVHTIGGDYFSVFYNESVVRILDTEINEN